MTLAIPANAGTPIFDDLDAHFATIPIDGTPTPEANPSQPPSAEVVAVDDANDSADFDAHVATIPVDSTPAADTTPEDTTPRARRYRAAWLLWLILATGVIIGAYIWLSAPSVPAVI
ncbi:hypothetical protein [Rhodococcus zopfii]|uniref:hypothetical protein n=1 Tax=Rhodococcus zopfii TaxID=43772 RepID=UPI0035274B39